MDIPSQQHRHASQTISKDPVNDLHQSLITPVG